MQSTRQEIKQDSNQLILSDDNGNTALHSAVLKYSTYNDMIIHFLSQIDQSALSTMAKTLNHQGKNPIDLISLSKLSENDQCYLRGYLIRLMDPIELKRRADDNIVLSDLLEKYQAKPNSKLYTHLRLCSTIFNSIRGKNILSTTHPRVNGWTEEKVSEIDKKITSIRDHKIDWQAILGNGSENSYKVSDNGEMYICQVTLSQNSFRKLLKHFVNLVKEYKAANCDELSCYALHKLFKLMLKLDVQTTGELFAVENSDHVFLVVGRDPTTDRDDYTTWNPDCVICDPLIGQIFPIGDLMKQLIAFKLMSFIQNDIRYIYNFAFYFNPNYHSLQFYLKNKEIEVDVPYDSDDKFFIGIVEKYLSNFSPDTSKFSHHKIVDSAQPKNHYR